MAIRIRVRLSPLYFVNRYSIRPFSRQQECHLAMDCGGKLASCMCFDYIQWFIHINELGPIKEHKLHGKPLIVPEVYGAAQFENLELRWMLFWKAATMLLRSPLFDSRTWCGIAKFIFHVCVAGDLLTELIRCSLPLTPGLTRQVREWLSQLLSRQFQDYSSNLMINIEAFNTILMSYVDGHVHYVVQVEEIKHCPFGEVCKRLQSLSEKPTLKWCIP